MPFHHKTLQAGIRKNKKKPGAVFKIMKTVSGFCVWMRTDFISAIGEHFAI